MSISVEEANRLVRLRGTVRGRATTNQKAVDQTYVSITSTNVEAAIQLLRRLIHSSTELQRLDAAIQPFVKQADETAEHNKALDYQQDIDNAVAALEFRIDTFKAA